MAKHVYNFEKEAHKFAVPAFIAAQETDGIDVEFLDKVTNNYGFLSRLMTSPATQSIFTVENGSRKYKQEVYDCDTGEIEVVIGKSIWTELPEDIGTACCHTKPDVNGNLLKAKPMRLCLRDCFDDLREHYLRMSKSGINLFGSGSAEQNYYEELRAWFTFFQARDIMLGQSTVSGNNIAPFPGVLELLNKAVVSYSGSDIVGVFEQIGCRFALLGGNYIFGANPLIVESIRKAVVRGGVYLDGFSDRGGVLYYRSYPIVADLNIPIDLTSGTGQVWVADLNKVGVFMERNLSNPFEQRIDNYTDSTTGDCFNSCIYLKNYGFAFTKDYNALFRIVDVPVDGVCLADNVLYGLGNLIAPDTLIPTYA